MNLIGQNNSMRIWLVRLLLLTMIFPATSLYAMPDQQLVSNDATPCHQSHGQSHTLEHNLEKKSCCDSLHQCAGDCDHGCSDCFSTSHSPCLILFSSELQRTEKLFAIPGSSYSTGVSPTLLLRPPRQFI